MEGGTTLADALLDDLDDLDDDFDDEGEEPVVDEADPKNGAATSDEARTDDDPNGSGTTTSSSKKPNSSSSLLGKRYLDDAHLQSHLKAIRENRNVTKAATAAAAAVVDPTRQQEQEYQWIVASNQHLQKLAHELSVAHAAACQMYGLKFPELEELLPGPLQYKNAIRVIGNEMDLTRVNEGLNEFLTSNQIITLSVAGSTTNGRPLTEQEMEQVEEIISYMDEIVTIQDELSQFVEERMEDLAPNVTALLGSSVAARLLGQAGGLHELVRIPACNLQVIGMVKHNSASRAGFARNNTPNAKNNGASGGGGGPLLAEAPLVRSVAKALQKSILKAVASKVALAARCDHVHLERRGTAAPSAQAGLKFRSEIEARISRLEEPDKAPVLKALPKPDLTVKKRRGGRRMRQLKARFEETAMMKQANTRAFSTQAGEYGDDAMGLTMGLLDTTAESASSAGSSIRRTTEKRKMGKANTKASRKRAAQMTASASSSSATSGLASTVAFTPLQAMELVNPDAQKEERVRRANQKWFRDNAGFQSALPKK